MGERELKSERSERAKVRDRREGELEDHGSGSSARGYFLFSSNKEKPQRY